MQKGFAIDAGQRYSLKKTGNCKKNILTTAQNVMKICIHLNVRNQGVEMFIYETKYFMADKIYDKVSAFYIDKVRNFVPDKSNGFVIGFIPSNTAIV